MIVTYCYTGTGAGCKARGLQIGMMGWSADDAVTGSFRRFPADRRDDPIDGKH